MISKDASLAALDNKQTSLLNQLLATLNTEQKIWLGGYLSGLNESSGALLKILNQNGSLPVSQATSGQSGSPALTIMYGTRSGNSKKLADKANKRAQSMGINTRLVDLNEYDPKRIKKEKNIMLIVSTDGEGEPPVSVEEFYNYLFSKKAPSLKDLQYSVLALGDKTYKYYCKIGKDIDERLADLGASRFFNRVDCDLDFEEDSAEWIQNTLTKQSEILATTDTANVLVAPVQPATETGTKESPYSAPVLDKILLNGRGSSKRTFHIELAIEDSGIQYTPGDSLGVISYNNEAFVSEFISEFGLKADETVETFKGKMSLQEAISNYYEITRLVPTVIKDLAGNIDNKKLLKFSEDDASLDVYCYGRDFIDLAKDYGIKLSAQELISNLRKLQPRLYSIASSYNFNPEEVHVTVAQVEYENNKRLRRGVCSDYLANIEDDANIEVYIDENISFRLPSDIHTPIILIGAGTGVAPYRAFLQERSLSDTKSQNWLFLGERNFTTDFIYQTEWQRFHKNGLLTNIDLAFSRDQKEKKYVQHKLLENSKEVYKWIRDGAQVYLCGDKNSMARDVKAALVEIFKNEGGFSAGSAEDFLRQLRRDKQFQEDVY